MWKEQGLDDMEKEQKIIQNLPSTLRKKLLIEANKMLLSESQIFKNNFSDVRFDGINIKHYK